MRRELVGAWNHKFTGTPIKQMDLTNGNDRTTRTCTPGGMMMDYQFRLLYWLRRVLTLMGTIMVPELERRFRQMTTYQDWGKHIKVSL